MGSTCVRKCQRQQPGKWRNRYIACSLRSKRHDEHLFEGRRIHGHLRK
jgi:hypothetical protein